MRLFRRKKKTDSYVQGLENILKEGFEQQKTKAKASGLQVVEVENFFRAANDANVELVKTMLAATPKLGTYVDNLGTTALSEVAYGNKDNHNRIAIAELLLEAGAKVNPEDRKKPPLFSAIDQNNLEMVRFLVKLGADIRLKNNKGIEPINICAGIGKVEIIEFLLECGADINVRRGTDGMTLLGYLYHLYGKSKNNLVDDVVEFVKSSGGY